MEGTVAIYEDEVRAADLIDQKKFDEAQDLLFRLSEGGSVYASMTLGWFYEMGSAGVKNTNAAKYFYERAVSVGSEEACWRLGGLLVDEGQVALARKAFENRHQERQSRQYVSVRQIVARTR